MARPQPTVFERNVPARPVVEHALSETRHATFWLDDLGAHTTYPALSGSFRADVVVVGGGYTGLWSALRAKQRHPGARVVLVDARSVGWAASGRDAGICGARLAHGARAGRARPADELEALARSSRENLAAIGSTVADLRLDCQWEPTGMVDLAIELHQIDWLLDAAAAATRAGAPHTFLDRAKVRAEIASPTYEAGLVRPDVAALVHPALLAVELARVASGLGVEIFEQTRATRLTPPGRGAAEVAVVRTTSPAGEATLRADRVLLGTGAFPALRRRDRRHTVPVYEHAIATEPLSADLLGAIGWRGRQGLADVAHRSHAYRLTADDRIVFSGHEGAADAGGNVSRADRDRSVPYRRLAEHLLTTFPQLEGIRLTHRWSALVQASRPAGVVVRQSAGGRVQHASSGASHGVAGSHAAAQVMLDRLDALDS